jgi:hypothetical protein
VFSSFCNDLGKAIGEAAEETALVFLGNRAAKHFQNVLSDMECIEQTGDIGLVRVGGGRQL